MLSDMMCDSEQIPIDEPEYAKYIHKEALVDWLKRKQDTTLKVVEDDLIQEVINHINKM